MNSQLSKEAYRVKRERLMQELKKLGINQRVLDVMVQIPREEFLPAPFRADAYKNDALPIGENQTISQPAVVALMTHALDVHKNHKVLEIGTGSGYQTAILCKLARRVFTIERFESLSQEASKLLHSLNINNFSSKIGDGTLGWPEQEPFDRIMATAAAPDTPSSLLNQLSIGGVLVIPVGAQGEEQRLMRYTKNEDGSISEYFIGYVRFVPMVGAQGVKLSTTKKMKIY